jgi:hypothetical protein
MDMPDTLKDVMDMPDTQKEVMDVPDTQKVGCLPNILKMHIGD